MSDTAAAHRVPLAKDGIYRSVQGEGHLRGFQMVFVRFGGCPVACPQCDTDYETAHSLDVGSVVTRVHSAAKRDPQQEWVWITGGEPAAYPGALRELVNLLHQEGYSVAVATSGVHRVIPPAEWLSVSPHGLSFMQTYGNELKIVPGLHGLDPFAWAEKWDRKVDFFYRYVQPLSVDGTEDPASLETCKEFLRRHPHWALSRQDHLVWDMP